MGGFVKDTAQSVVGLVGKVLGVEQPKVPEMAAPTPPTPAATPSVATPSVQAAAQAARRRERVASGRAATMLSSGGSDGSTGTKKLLGQ